MNVRKIVSHIVLLGVLAPASIAYGEPPPKQPTEPGITAPQAL